MDEYYHNYLKLHRNPKCRLLHFVGLWLTILYVGIIATTGAWFGLLLAPFIIYPFAWTGHYVFEKNKPAAFNNPIKAKIADWIMFKDILLGRLTIW
tara:strand:+ start:2355 stop:2642 length:288 start_codon:yes stop_codon:yes gene_type:complete